MEITPNGRTAGEDSLTARRHIPGLDGIRAIAILMVIIHHAVYTAPRETFAQKLFLHIAGQGWAGVDLFFVLSGFLITGILMDARDSSHALRNFYARRVLRIVPVYVAFLLFSLWVAPSIDILSASEAVQLHTTQIWFWTYSVNLLIALHSWTAVSFPVVHLWSLAVEEQFYLLWPFAVLLLSPRMVQRTAIGCIVGAEVCRLVFILGGAGGQVNYVMLPSRMDSLAAGALLACAFRDPTVWASVLRARPWIIAIACLLLVIVISHSHTIDNQAPLEQLIAFPALVALSSVAIASAVGSAGWLTHRLFRFIGKISYGMYVWHVEVLRLAQHSIPLPTVASPLAIWAYYGMIVATVLGVTVAVALMSWYLIEQPFLRLKRFVPSS